MNNIKILVLGIVLTCLHSCGQTLTETQYTTSATIFLINNTSVVIKSDTILGYVIQPGDTLIHRESYASEYNNKPSINNYSPFATNNSLFIYGDNSECELGLNTIENYENRKETSPLEFEFTFRFTEEKKANSSPCNL